MKKAQAEERPKLEIGKVNELYLPPSGVLQSELGRELNKAAEMAIYDSWHISLGG